SRIISLSMQIAFSCLGPFAFASTFLNTPVEEFRSYLNESYNHELSVGGYETLWNVLQNFWFPGSIIGFFLAPMVNDTFGRKVGLLSGNCWNLISAIMQWAGVHFYVPSLLLFGRFISSIATAIAFQSTVLYLQEFPPTARRGTTSYMSDVVYSFFAVICMSLGTRQLLGETLSIFMAVQIVLCVVSVAITIQLHESPKYLLIKKKDEEAALASTHFFHGAESVESVKQFIQELKAEGSDLDCDSTSLKDFVHIFTDPTLRKTMFLGLAALQMVVPLWTLMFNSTDLLLDLDASKFISQWTSSGMIVCYFIGTLFGSHFIDRIGRRTLFIPCSVLLSVGIAAVAAAFYMKTIVPHAEFTAVAGLLIAGLVFGLGVGSIAWFIAPELSPQRYRSKIQSMVAVLNMIQSAIFTFAVMPLYRAFGAWIFLVLFCLVCALCDIFLYFELPETKGRPISEITEEVRNGLKMRRRRVGDDIENPKGVKTSAL
ncbi:hypothetical protein PFISCL1PPCAC_9313, partial [Pristionchus fissidentatus]